MHSWPHPKSGSPVGRFAVGVSASVCTGGQLGRFLLIALIDEIRLASRSSFEFDAFVCRTISFKSIPEEPPAVAFPVTATGGARLRQFPSSKRGGRRNARAFPVHSRSPASVLILTALHFYISPRVSPSLPESGINHGGGRHS